MNWTVRIRNWLRGVADRSSVEREMNAEMQFHIESYADDLVRSGMAPEEALRRARMEFGAMEARKEDCRASLGLRLWDELHGDLRYTLRVLRKAPGFTAVAVATLALGIGANTAIFTLIDAVLLRLAPVHHPEQLYQVQIVRPAGSGRHDGSFTNPLWEELRARQDVFSGMAAWGTSTFNLARGGAVQPARGLWVSGNYFATLGVRPAAGRMITTVDDRRGCPAVAVLSYGFWQERYGSSPDAVGRTLTLDSQPFEIIGVTAPGFYGLDVGQKFDVAVPICVATLFNGPDYLGRRSTWWLTVVGRIKPELTREQMRSGLAAISPAVMRATLPQDWAPQYQKDYLARRFVHKAAGNGISWPWSLRDQFREPLTVLMAVVGIVLLIACANVAALLLARGAAQRREIAVRLALGAGRLRLVRQTLLHSLALSLAGAAAGVLLAEWGTRVLVAALSTRRDPVFLDLTPDWRIAAFTAGVVVLTACVFGALPALRSTRVPLTDSMRSNPASQTERRSPLRKGIVAAQIALSLVLLIVAGLFLRSFAKLFTLDPGFDRENVLLVRVDLSTTHIKPEQRPATLDQMQQRLAALPGVLAVGHCNIIPLGGTAWNDTLHSDVPNLPLAGESDSLMNFVSPGYLSALRIPLLEGRDITPSDTKSSPPVALVNRAFARKFFGTANPIGHVIRVDEINGQPGAPIQVVGLVADAKYQSIREEMKPTAFFPLTQIPHPDEFITFAVRTTTRPEAVIKAVETTAAEINREIPLDFTTLARQVDDAMVQERLLAMLSAFFGAMALLLAMIGLYGTVSYQVTLRKTEFGIRMALGAQVGSIIRLVVREVLVIIIVGVAAGISISLVATSALGKLLFGLGPRDTATIVAAALALSLVALLAALAPARRAARVHPMIALRCE